ncbi:methyl-accepting chemotaxis protein [Thalassospira marina]|uniref:Methyl-accepting chemotaxis protein n=1 Tax=Thalassospira marina TaxID=2048283 RepID=A0A2N3KUR5_9PROT|nr:methyl-accepting chemotaxis protein [Thalassospira marina]PKR54268.1 hypothetical protein COO20_08960 [Thalassospira marina]
MPRSSAAGTAARSPKKNMRLAVKLPLLVAISSLISILVLGAADYWLASNDIRNLSADKLTALLDARTSTLNRLLNVENQSVERLANSLQIKEANDSFASGWALEGDGGAKNLRRLFIDENPNPADQRAELTKPEERTPYTRYHNRFHVDLRGIATERQYRSLMLVSLTGDVIYSVNKRDEFAKNINDGDFPYPALSSLMKQVMADPAGTPVAFGDFVRNVPNLISRFVVAPIVADKSDIRGYLVVEEPVTEINEVTADAAGLGDTGSIYLVGPDQLLRTVDRQMNGGGDNAQAVLTALHKTAPVTAALAGESGVMTYRDGENIEKVAAYQPIQYGNNTWAMIAEARVSEIMAPVANLRNSMIVRAIAILVVIGLVGQFIVRRVIRQLDDVRATMVRLADDDLSAEIPSTERTDEIGEFARALAIFKRNIQERRNMRRKEEEKKAEQLEHSQRLQSLTEKFESEITDILAKLNASMGHLDHAGQSMKTAAEKTRTLGSDALGHSQSASDDVTTVSTATTELSSSIDEIGRSSATALNKSEEAVNEAEAANNKILDLDQSVSKIGEIVAMISGIAEQTNLLALNATIEAARAGDAGKGFAVVAGEVKNLSSQTAKATEEISRQIAEVQGETAEAVKAIETITRTIGELSVLTASISTAIEQQGSATAEISQSASSAARGTQSVISSIDGVAKASQESDLASREVTRVSDELSQQGNSLKSAVDGFLSGVRRD